MQPPLLHICILLFISVTISQGATVAIPCCSLSTLQPWLANQTAGTTFQLAAGTFTGCPMYNLGGTGLVSFNFVGSAGGTTIDCQSTTGSNAFFTSSSSPGVTMTISNMTIKNTDHSAVRIYYQTLPNGAATNMVIRNVAFVNIGGPTSNGCPGVFWTGNGNLEINGCSFNNVSNYNNAGANGGAILVESTGATVLIAITNSNAVGGCGGGIFLGGVNMLYSITNTTVNGNTANLRGAGLCTGGASYTNNSLTISGSTFNQNTVTSGLAGGAYMAGQRWVYSITNTTFAQNSVFIGSQVGAGVVIDSIYSNLTFTGSSFLSNTGSNGGSGVYVATSTGNALQFVACTFTNNNALNAPGGALAFEDGITYGTGAPATSNLALTITDSTFTANTARAGGAIALTGANLTVFMARNTFTGNLAIMTGGGAIYAYNSTLPGTVSITLQTSKFTSNTATATAGGAVGIWAVAPAWSVQVVNTTFTSNYGQLNGGGLGLMGPIAVTISGSTFTQNSAPLHGGSCGNGGGLCISSMGASVATGMRVMITTTTFLSNSAYAGGGAYLGGSSMQYVLDRVTVDGNQAQNFGGGLMFDYAVNSYAVTNSEFSWNSCGTGGGAAVWCAYSASNTLLVSSSVFKHNSSPAMGSALFSIAATVINGSSSFFLNQASGTYGAIYQNGATLTLANDTSFGGNLIPQTGNNLFPFEMSTTVSPGQCVPPTGVTWWFPYYDDGCPGVVGYPCKIVCLPGLIANATRSKMIATCSTPGGTYSSAVTCVPETVMTTKYISKNLAVKYGTRNVPAATNMIGQRSKAAMIHSPDYPNFALVFGGQGLNLGCVVVYQDDTWTIDTSGPDPVWTWVAGSSNTTTDKVAGNSTYLSPRYNAQSWVDGSTAFLYGGGGWAGTGYYVLGDLWTLNMNNVAAGWTYSRAGSASTNPPGAPVYGTQGAFSNTSHPGGRLRAGVWQMPAVASHLAFFYGGEGYSYTYGDIWALNCTSRMWAWIGGPTTPLSDPVYSNVSDPTLWPGAREEPAIWVVKGVVYLYGGSKSTPTGLVAFNDVWSATYNAASMTFVWTWLSGPQGVNTPAPEMLPNVFSTTNFPRPLFQPQYLRHPAFIDTTFNELLVWGGQSPDQTATYGEVWAVRPETRTTAWISGTQLGNVPWPDDSFWGGSTFGAFPFNGSYIPGMPAPRHAAMVWPDYTRPGEFYVADGCYGGSAYAYFLWAQRIHRISTFSGINVTSPATAINGIPTAVSVSFIHGNVLVPANTVSRILINSTAGSLVTLNGTLPNGVLVLNVSIPFIPANTYYSLVSITLTINDRFTATFTLNVTCPNNCDTCSPVWLPQVCKNCDPGGFVYSSRLGSCVCNVSAGLGRAVPASNCMSCNSTSGRYLNADTADCSVCAPVAACAVAPQCTSPTTSRCAQCATGYYVRSGPDFDVCVPCSTHCSATQFISQACSINDDIACSPCTSCPISFPGTYQALPCKYGANQYNDSTCAPCMPVEGCASTLTCNFGNASLCTFGCDAGRFYVRRYPDANDVCQPCSVCPNGTYTHGICVGTADFTCPACQTGCSMCTSPGLDSANCQACNATAGFLWNLHHTACVSQCAAIGEYPEWGNSSMPAQCRSCSHGCEVCAGEGLVAPVCTACNETAGFLLSVDLSQCVDVCSPGSYPNTTGSPDECHTCEGKTCPTGQYRTCTNPADTACQDCTPGCKSCIGPGLSLLDYCLVCDDNAGMAPSEDGTMCVPCAANCSRCTTSPTDCSICADGYATPPGCAPVCSSPGCIGCQSPGACLLCDPSFAGSDCGKCSDKTQFGSGYPNCVPARQTDTIGTGASMGALALLALFVTVVALYKPLPVFYAGKQVIRTPSQDIPLTIDFVLSMRRLQLTLSPQFVIESATIEGVGLLPGSVTFIQEEEKGPYTATLQMTAKQTQVFLSRQMRVDVNANAGSGVIRNPHPLLIPMRINGANLLAVFTILLDFIQLSSFGFSSSFQWWTSDPVPSTLHYTLIQLPSKEDLWYVAYWALVGLAGLWVLIVLFLKLGGDAKLAKYRVFSAVSSPIYGFLMPLVGQTLYLPIITTMLSALACSKPVTVPNSPYLANFNEQVVCWQGSHWIYVAVSCVILLVYYPLAVYTSPLWQTTNANLDVRYFPAFLIVSGQMKFVLSVTAQLFGKVPLVLSILLIILPLPVVVMTLRRSPGIIAALHWPITASYASVAWSGIASIVALLYPGIWFTSIVLYAGWFLLFVVAVFLAVRRPKTEETTDTAGADALRRVLAGNNSSAAAPRPAREAFDEIEKKADSSAADAAAAGDEDAVDATPEPAANSEEKDLADSAPLITDSKNDSIKAVSTPDVEMETMESTTSKEEKPGAAAATVGKKKPAATRKAPAL